MKRIEREKKTVNSMIVLYCKKHHHPETELCEACLSLINYSNKRLEKCRFGNRKPVCSKCPVHCYKPGQRAQIKEVMRYAGPKMIIYKPRLALLHLTDKWQKV